MGGGVFLDDGFIIQLKVHESMMKLGESYLAVVSPLVAAAMATAASSRR